MNPNKLNKIFINWTYPPISPFDTSTPNGWGLGKVDMKLRLKGLKHRITPSAQPINIKFSPTDILLALVV